LNLRDLALECFLAEETATFYLSMRFALAPLPAMR
jgi:hypothetical protein